MNNKKLGNAFESEMVEWLADHGWWVHFISPDRRGAQPFDIIAVRNDEAIVADCKTSSLKSISIDRLETNQIMAFEKWMSCGNSEPYIFVKHEDEIYAIKYMALKQRKRVKLDGFLRIK